MDSALRRSQTAPVREPDGRAPEVDAGAMVGVRERDWLTTVLLGGSLVAAALAASAPLWAERMPAQPLPFWLSVAGGIALTAAGFVSSRWGSPRLITRLILLSAILYFAPFAIFSSSAVLFTFGLLMQGYWMPVAGHFIIAFPDGRLRSRLERVVLGAAYGWSTFVRTGTLFSDPRAAGCDECPDNLLMIRSDPAVLRILEVADSVIPVAVTSLVVAVLVQRWLRSTLPERRVLNPMFAAIAVNLVTAIALYAALGLTSRGLISDEHLLAVVVVQLTSLLLFPVGIIVGQVRSVLARSAVANLLVRIGEGRTVAELERDVAWVLGDPSVRITSGGADDGVAGIEGDRLTVIGTVGAERLSILHDPSLRRYQPELLAAVTAATRVALENQRLQAEETLMRPVPAGLAERLQREGRQIGDVATTRISVLMSDIRDYSTIAEAADLQTLALQLHRHRVAMNRAIAGHGGVVMQFVGDAVFAIFGAPESMDGHALAAVRAAMDMQRVQRGINEEWQLAGLEPFRIGIGVTTGNVAAALLGSPEHVEYSVVGDVVNLAQRLQGWANDGDIVLSEETFAGLGGSIAAERLPVGTVKGRRGAVLAYRIAVSQEATVTQATHP